MGYALLQDMIDRFGEPELVAGTNLGVVNSGIVEETVLNAALGSADSMIDSYLRGRYSLPLAEVPVVLVDAACDIARFRLWKNQVSEVVKDRYDRTIAFLKQVAKGEVVLANPTDQSDLAESDGPDYQADERVFSRDKLEDF